MKILPKALCCATLTLLSAFAADAAEKNCQLQPVAFLAMNKAYPWRVMVRGKVGGQPVDWIVDTGAPYLILNKKVAEAAGSKIYTIGGSRLRIYGGHSINAYTMAKDFQLGGLKVHRIKMPLLPDDIHQEGNGLLGADFLGHFDDDFDFARHRLTLLMPHRCDGKAVYWTQDQSQISKIRFHFRDPRDPHIHVSVRLDGHDLDTIIDTGAPGSLLMPLDWAEEVYDIDKSKLKPVGDPALKRFTYPFSSLKLGGITVDHPYVVLQSRESSHEKGYTAILGMHILTKLHMLISYTSREIYVTPARAGMAGMHKGA